MYNNFNLGHNMPPQNQFPQFMPPTSYQNAHPLGKKIVVPVDSAPYPEVAGDIDLATVALLKEDYAGGKGELTVVTQYVFQSGRTTDNDSYANGILQIAITEMMHLDMLGDAIVALGGNPSFDNGKYYWCASNVNYAMSYKDMLKANIVAESDAIANYEKHIAMTKNESVKALLRRIVEDEKLHLKFFEELLAKNN